MRRGRTSINHIPATVQILKLNISVLFDYADKDNNDILEVQIKASSALNQTPVRNLCRIP